MKYLTYKQKNKYLLMLSVLSAMFIYFLSIEKTINLYSEYSELKEQQAMIGNAPQREALYRMRLTDMEKQLGNLPGGTGYSQERLLETVSTFCQRSQLILKDFPSPTVNDEKGYEIETSVFRVEGNFINLLKLVYHLEQEKRTGRIASLRFHSKKDLQTKKTHLTATVYLQNIKKATS